MLCAVFGSFESAVTCEKFLKLPLMPFWADLDAHIVSKPKNQKSKEPTPAEGLMAEVLQTVFGNTKKRATGLMFPLPYYARLYNIPLITIKRIHLKYNPCALDHPAKLLPLLMEQPGPKIDLTGMEKVVAARFAAGLKDHEKVSK